AQNWHFMAIGALGAMGIALLILALFSPANRSKRNSSQKAKDTPTSQPEPSGSESPSVPADHRKGVIRTATGRGYVANIRDVPDEEVEQLAGECGLGKAVIRGLFGVLDKHQVAMQDLDSHLRDLVAPLKTLVNRLKDSISTDPTKAAKEHQLCELLETGNFDRVEELLRERAFLDVSTIRQQAEETDKQIAELMNHDEIDLPAVESAKRKKAAAYETLHAAAAAKSDLATLKMAQMDYREAAKYYREAAGLIPDTSDLVRGKYLDAWGYAAILSGDPAEAVIPLKEAVEIRERELGPDHPDVAQSLGRLAAAYQGIGDLSKAESLSLRSLEILKLMFGENHAEYASALDETAEIYRAEGKFEEAEEMLVKSLDITVMTSGQDHPDAARSLNNLGLLFHEHGKHADAESFYRRALTLLESVFGPDSPHLAPTLNNLAQLYQDQGNDLEAERLYRKSLAITQESVGPKHPQIAVGLTNLAGLYLDRRRFMEAERLYKKAFEITRDAYGSKHEKVAYSLDNLARLHQEKGSLLDAEMLYERSLNMMESIFGPDHPKVADCLINLGALYRYQQRYSDAEPIYERALTILERVLGPDHPKVAKCLINLARISYFSGRSRNA
ncbi:MAG TPA: tetratricopeptide repeat-containing protein, partial [bacterium]|nr:tetratricopeptide repeat-containing protein [bacterium]